MEPSRRRSDGDPSSPVGWRALRSERWKWEGSKTDLGRVEGWKVEGWNGGVVEPSSSVDIALPLPPF